MSALRTIAQRLSDALRPLERALASPAGFRSLLLRLGWRASDIPPEWQALAADVSTVASAAGALADDPGLADMLAAFTAAGQLRDHVNGLSTAPPGVDSAALLADLRERLVARLVIDELAKSLPRSFALLQLLGVVQREPISATATRPAHAHYRIDLDPLSTLVHDPSSLPAAIYRAGTAHFDSEWVNEILFETLLRFRLPARLERTAATLPGHDAVTVAGSYVRVPLLDVPLGDTVISLGFTIAALSPDAGGPGLVLAPWLPALTEPMPLGGGASLRLITGTGAPLQVALVVTPSGVAVHYPTGAIPLTASGIGVAATIPLPGRLGRASGTRFELGGVVVSLIIGDDAHGAFVRVGARLNGAKLTLATGDQDGVVSRVLGARDLSTEVPIGVEWSSRDGISFTLGPGTLGVPGALRLGPVELADTALALSSDAHRLGARITSRVTVALGPLTIALDRLGAGLEIDRDHPGALGLGRLDASIVLPTGAGLTIDSAIVRGGGFIERDPARGRYGGAIFLDLLGIQATGAALLDTRTPEGRDLVSFVALVSTRFPGIPIGMGFVLDGLGGLFAINRRADDDRLRAAVRAGQIAELLLPDDPRASLPHLLKRLGELFPVAPGRFVAGPSAQIGWGTPRMFAADVMVLLEAPSPIRFLLLASAALGLPTLDHQIVKIRIDAFGVLDLGRGTLALDASLHDSSLAGYALTGDMALRLGWGSAPHFLLSFGGFHPHFVPPPGFPALRRLALTAGDNPQLRLSAYLALTSNTAQVGAQADLTASGAGFEIKAHLGFDALFEFVPFHFEIEITASASLSWHGHRLLGVDLDFVLSGPHPWHAKGEATFGILWWDVSVGFDETWGDRTPLPPPPPPQIAKALLDALAERSAWASELPSGRPSWVVLDGDQSGDTIKVHPSAALVVRQRAVPLGYDITQFGSVPLSVSKRFAVSHVKVGTDETATPPVKDAFAPGQFTRLRNDQRLVAPSFESLQSGVRVGDGEVRGGSTARSSMDIDTVEVDPLAPPHRPPRPFDTPPEMVATANTVRPTRPPRPTPRRGPRLADLDYVLASTDDLSMTAEGGVIGGGARTYGALREALRERIAATGRVPRLQIVPRIQVANHSARVVVVREDDNMRNIDFVDTVTGRPMTRAEFVAAIHAGEYPDYLVRTIHGVPTPVSRPNATASDNLG